jgi:transposase
MTSKPFWTTASKELSNSVWTPDPGGGNKTTTRLGNHWIKQHEWEQNESHAMKKVKIENPCDFINIDKLPTEPLPKRNPLSKSNKVPAGKAIKIRFYPNKLQVQVLNQWMGTYRFIYNACINDLNSKTVPHTMQNLRDQYVKNTNDPTDLEHLPWMYKLPRETRDYARAEAQAAIATNMAKKRKNPNHQFQVRFKSKKLLQQESFTIAGGHNRALKPVIGNQKAFRLFPTDMITQTRELKDYNQKSHHLATDKFKTTENVPMEAFQYECDVIRNKLGQWFLAIPKPLEIKTKHVPKHKIISLDPGSRTFLTGYSPDAKHFIEVGDGTMEKRIRRLESTLDDLISRASKPEIKSKKRYRMKRAANRIRLKIRNIISDCHRHAAKHLVDTYQVILLPHFETQEMVDNTDNDRKIGKKTARSLMTWSHYKFKMLLKAKSREYPNTRVVCVDEHHTSMTCSDCGWQHKTLGANKTFHCGNPSCKMTMDRDWNAAKNIFVRSYDKELKLCLSTTPHKGVQGAWRYFIL